MLPKVSIGSGGLIFELSPLLEGYSIIELSPPKDFIGKSLQDLDLINRLGIQIIAVKEVIKDRLILIPTAKFVIKDSDILIMLGRNETLDKLKAENCDYMLITHSHDIVGDAVWQRPAKAIHLGLLQDLIDHFV